MNVRDRSIYSLAANTHCYEFRWCFPADCSCKFFSSASQYFPCNKKSKEMNSPDWEKERERVFNFAHLFVFRSKEFLEYITYWLRPSFNCSPELRSKACASLLVNSRVLLPLMLLIRSPSLTPCWDALLPGFTCNKYSVRVVEILFLCEIVRDSIDRKPQANYQNRKAVENYWGTPMCLEAGNFPDTRCRLKAAAQAERQIAALWHRNVCDEILVAVQKLRINTTIVRMFKKIY